MPENTAKLTWCCLVVTLIAGLSFAKLASPLVAGQNAHAGAVTGVIDGVSFEGGQY
jgi:hypothetical protein